MKTQIFLYETTHYLNKEKIMRSQLGVKNPSIQKGAQAKESALEISIPTWPREQSWKYNKLCFGSF